MRIRRDEQGNLIAAIGVLMVLFLLSLAVLARTLGTLHSVTDTQNFSAALASADGGMADALFQIDQVQGASFNGSGSFGGSTYAYTATKVDDDTWTVRARGKTNDSPHAIEATVERDVRYPYALFTEQNLTFAGCAALNVTSYNSITGLLDTGNAVVGSNGDIVIDGCGGGDAQHYYTPAGTCTGCPNDIQKPGPRVNAEPDPPTSFLPCPTGGVFGSLVAGTLVVTGGTYKCSQDISFAPGGVMTILNPPLKIWTDGAVTIANASINTGSTARASYFTLEKAGSAPFNVGTGSNAGALFGIVYAPSTDVVVDGGQMHLDGSLTLNSLQINGNPNFELRYDDSIRTILSTDWEVRDWHEIPSSQYCAVAVVPCS